MVNPLDQAARTDFINTVGRIAVSIFTLVMFAGVCFTVILKAVPPSETTSLIIGAVIGMAGTTIAYWVGSSSGSTAKDARQATMQPPPQPGTTTTIVAAPQVAPMPEFKTEGSGASPAAPATQAKEPGK